MAGRKKGVLGVSRAAFSEVFKVTDLRLRAMEVARTNWLVPPAQPNRAIQPPLRGVHHEKASPIRRRSGIP